jgi:hypothetical protein
VNHTRRQGAGAPAGRGSAIGDLATPGKRTLTASLSVPRSVASAASDATAIQATAPAVQRQASAEPALRGDAPTEIAGRGVAGAGGARPHLDRIQQLFGRHERAVGAQGVTMDRLGDLGQVAGAAQDERDPARGGHAHGAEREVDHRELVRRPAEQAREETAQLDEAVALGEHRQAADPELDAGLEQQLGPACAVEPDAVLALEVADDPAGPPPLQPRVLARHQPGRIDEPKHAGSGGAHEEAIDRRQRQLVDEVGAPLPEPDDRVQDPPLRRGSVGLGRQQVRLEHPRDPCHAAAGHGLDVEHGGP